MGDFSGDASEATISIVFGSKNGGTIGLRCRRAAGNGATGTGANPIVTYADVSAIQVGSLTP